MLKYHTAPPGTNRSVPYPSRNATSYCINLYRSMAVCIAKYRTISIFPVKYHPVHYHFKFIVLSIFYFFQI